MTLTIPGGQEVKLSFSYEKLPNFCYLCGVIGHIEDRCEIRYNQSFVHPGDHTPFGPWLRASNRHANPSGSLHFCFGEPQPAIDSSHSEGHSSSWKTPVGNQTNIQSCSSSPLYRPPHIRRNSVDHDVSIPSRAPENLRGSRSRCRLRLVDESDDDLAGENLNLLGQATSSPLGTIVSNSLPVNPPPGSNLSLHAKSNSTTNSASISPQLPNPVSSSRLIEISSPIVISQHKCDRAYPALSDNISCMPPHSLPMQPTSPMHSPTPSVQNILHINPPPSPMLINIPLQISLTPPKVPKSLSVNHKIRKNKHQKISPPFIINNQTLRLTDIPVSEFAQNSYPETILRIYTKGHQHPTKTMALKIMLIFIFVSIMAISIAEAQNTLGRIHVNGTLYCTANGSPRSKGKRTPFFPNATLQVACSTDVIANAPVNATTNSKGVYLVVLIPRSNATISSIRSSCRLFVLTPPHNCNRKLPSNRLVSDLYYVTTVPTGSWYVTYMVASIFDPLA
ncbi:hypothetical protein BUALT_Bualt13G0056500 [Buddleja alternifolia]|uniref:Zinc knuckle CX2CX4HX4C domain-containing protein n=1 Tax=Buddleja alternifolia TaxID=168488 RepID=A0AAV6WU57_9LAMI|nr:hypothetical protein BUALT_Bualt13G0056500 [Buddleja alternifolia]